MGGLKNAKKISLGVLTVETNQDLERYFSICREQLLKLVEIISLLLRQDFFFSVKILIATVQINWDRQYFQDLSRLFEIYCYILTLAQKSWRIEKSRLRNMIKLTNYQSRFVEICQKFHVSTDFSISIKTSR